MVLRPPSTIKLSWVPPVLYSDVLRRSNLQAPAYDLQLYRLGKTHTSLNKSLTHHMEIVSLPASHISHPHGLRISMLLVWWSKLVRPYHRATLPNLTHLEAILSQLFRPIHGTKQDVEVHMVTRRVIVIVVERYAAHLAINGCVEKGGWLMRR